MIILFFKYRLHNFIIKEIASQGASRRGTHAQNRRSGRLGFCPRRPPTPHSLHLFLNAFIHAQEGSEGREPEHTRSPTQHQRQAGRRIQPAGEVNPARTKRPPRQSNEVGQTECSLSAVHTNIYENVFVVGRNKHESSARCRPHMFSYEYVFAVGRNKHRSEADPGFTSWQFLVAQTETGHCDCSLS